VGTNQIDETWPRIVSYFKEALDFGSHDLTLWQLYVMCRSGAGFLFVSDDLSAALIIKFDRRNNDSIAELVIFGGKGDTDWKKWENALSEFVRRQGVHKVIMNGRPGLEKVISGAKVRHVCFEIEV